MIGYSIIKLLGENPRDELWPNVKLVEGISVNEMSVMFYTEKLNFIKENKPRFRRAIEFIERNNLCEFSEEPNYAALREIISDLFKGERDHKEMLKREAQEREEAL